MPSFRQAVQVLICFALESSLLTVPAHSESTTTHAAQSQTKKPVASTTILLVDTDDSCRLTVDDQDEGVITPDQSKKIKVGLGDHIVKCVVENAPDLVWRKVVVAKSSEQAAAIVALKALHIQYDQAVGQAQQQKQQAAAAEQKRETDEKEFPGRFFGAVKGVWRVNERKVADDPAEPSGPKITWNEENILEFKNLNGLIIDAQLTYNRDGAIYRSTLYSVSFKISPPTPNLTQEGELHCIKYTQTSTFGKNKNQPQTRTCGDPKNRPLQIRVLDSTHLELTNWGAVSVLTKSS